MFGYDFIIEYKAGKGNRVADALSRQTKKGHCMNAETREQEQKVLKLAAISVPIPSWLEEIDKGIVFYKSSYGSIETAMQGEQTSANWYLKEDVLFYTERIFLESNMNLIPEILAEFHKDTHEGIQKTIKRLCAVFYRSKMHKDVISFLRKCKVCQQLKSSNLVPAGLLQPSPIPQQVWMSVSMDFITGPPRSRGKAVILVVVNRLS